MSKFSIIDLLINKQDHIFINMEEEMAKQCSVCGKNESFIRSIHIIEGKEYCGGCKAEKEKSDRETEREKLNNLLEQMRITTTNHIDGYRVRNYIGIESVEFVIGTGIFSEITTDLQDFFGARSTAFELKLKNAKEFALKKLKYLAHEKGGNAVIGVDLDYTEFSGNRIGLIANGTVVDIEPIRS